MTSTSISPDMMDDFREDFVSRLSSVNKEIFNDTLKIHNTKKEYFHDMARRMDAIRTMQRDLHRYRPELTLNLVQVAFLVHRLDYKTLCGYKVSETLACLKNVESFVKCCLGRADELLRRDADSGDDPKYAACFRIFHKLHRDLWLEISKIICNLVRDDESVVAPFDGDFVKFPYPIIYPLLNNAWIGFNPIKKTPRQQYSFDPSKDSICMEWRYTPRYSSEAFAGPEGEEFKFLEEEPRPGKPATSCMMDVRVNHPELASFFERNMHDNRREGGSPFSSGPRFLIQVQRKDADSIIDMLEMMCMIFQISSCFRLAEMFDYYREHGNSEWGSPVQAMERRARKRFERMIRFGKEAKAAKVDEEWSEVDWNRDPLPLFIRPGESRTPSKPRRNWVLNVWRSWSGGRGS